MNNTFKSRLRKTLTEPITWPVVNGFAPVPTARQVKDLHEAARHGSEFAARTLARYYRAVRREESKDGD